MAAVLLSPGSLSPPGKTKWSAPRTPDGRPDLQGMWTNATYTPLQRPANLGQRRSTPTRNWPRSSDAGSRRLREETEPGTAADVHYDFSQFGLDRGQGVVAPNKRTSLIVDPPDGRIPPLTAEGQKRAAARAEARKQMGGPFDGRAESAAWPSAASSGTPDRRCFRSATTATIRSCRAPTTS